MLEAPDTVGECLWIMRLPQRPARGADDPHRQEWAVTQHGTELARLVAQQVRQFGPDPQRVMERIDAAVQAHLARIRNDEPDLKQMDPLDALEATCPAAMGAMQRVAPFSDDDGELELFSPPDPQQQAAIVGAMERLVAAAAYVAGQQPLRALTRAHPQLAQEAGAFEGQPLLHCVAGRPGETVAYVRGTAQLTVPRDFGSLALMSVLRTKWDELDCQWATPVSIQ